MSIEDGLVRPINLADEARRRYLNYALSVVTSRALPDVRDGMKPVQRRILYAMHRDFHLSHDGRYRKSATVVGRVIGVYHPHGDQAVYEAMVRMAQPFSMRAPLVDGHGNFGSLDGDPPAAYRYTEVKLQKLASALLDELGEETVPTRPNFDGTAEEPSVLPAQFPQLLVNGSAGIAVGMATSIPPHNLREVVNACLRLIKNRDLSVAQLMTTVKGPDFPVGGEVVTDRAELVRIYEEGRGTIKVRGTYIELPGKRGTSQLVVDSVPYLVNKAALVERIAEIIVERKVPGLLDVRDESTDDVRVVLELKAGTDPATVMAYLYRHTPLESGFSLNMMCLVPTGASDVLRPERLGLAQVLLQFLDFRLAVVTRRLAYQLRKLRERIHILEGFRKVFDGLDEAIAIIRASDGKADASVKLQARFRIDEVQADAVLETKLHRLARLEIKKVVEELKAKLAEAERIDALLASEDRRWDLISDELRGLAKEFGDPRRTHVGEADEEVVYDPGAYIHVEDTNVVLTRDGWLKRVQALKDPKGTRVRDGDEVVAVLPGSTRECVVLFSNHGSAYVMRIGDVPATGGYGDPVQKYFRFGDGERVVGALSLDQRMTPPDMEVGEDEIPPPYLFAATREGQVMLFPAHGHREPSTRVGRKYCKLRPTDEVVIVALPTEEHDLAALVTGKGRGIIFKLDEVPVLSGPGLGVRGIKVDKDDWVIGAGLLSGRPRDVVRVETGSGREVPVSTVKYRVTGRGGKGFGIVKRGGLRRVVPPEVVVVELAPEPGAGGELLAGDDEQADGGGLDPGTAGGQGELF